MDTQKHSQRVSSKQAQITMHRYVVAGASAHIPAGLIVKLDDEQAKSWAVRLQRTKGDPAGFYTVINPITMSPGEVFGCNADLSLYRVHSVSRLPDDPGK